MAQIIGKRFKIENLANDVLGQGGMGTVYRGLDLDTNQPVAIKALKPELAQPALIERFQREGRALRDLNHPHIVKMIASVEEVGQYYLVMEYVKGGSLRDLLDATPQPALPQVLDITLDLADALTRAHRLDIIHRDIKPANILLAEDGSLRLTDFGVARLNQAERVTETGAALGTLDYLSPKALNGEAVDTRSDIWAFGVLLFEMLAGQRPFTGRNLSEILLAITTRPTPDLEALRPDLSLDLVDLVYRMLEKEPSARIESVRLVGAAMEAVMQGEGAREQGGKGAGGQRGEIYDFNAPTPSLSLPKHNLPAQVTPFVGREEELTELGRLLADATVRLVTVLGPGGMGKTRLGLAHAEQELGQFQNGVYFVALAPLSEPKQIVTAIAEATGYPFQADARSPKQQILDFLQPKQTLLVLDNFEHLLVGATLVSEILQTAPKVKLLITSRERLKLSGETIFVLQGLDFPDWETPEDALTYSAVKLFVQSAKRAQPGFELLADDLHYVARICRLTQGMPLGIVLAGAWLEMLSPQEIATELSQNLDLLETDLDDVPARQRSIRTVFDYAWERLTENEQTVLMKASVFRDGFIREAAQAVTRASLRVLMSLVNKSLLQRDGEGRYQIHELLRQYAVEKLPQFETIAKDTRNQHCGYYSAFLGNHDENLKGENQQSALAALDLDIENARIAWQWAVKQKKVANYSPKYGWFMSLL